MERVELYNLINEKVKLLSKIPVAEMEDSTKYGRGKKAAYHKNRQGLYFLYNADDKIIYIGKVGPGKRTSLFHRMKGHGSGAHNKQKWYKEVKYGHYINLPNLNIDELEKLERICIQCNENHNNYNDKYIIELDVDNIFNKCSK